MRTGIAIAGNLIVDFVKEIDAFPQQGMLGNIRRVEKSIGGCVPNTLIDLSKIDGTLKLCAYGRVGGDDNGRFIIDTLNQQGIATAGIITDENAVTSFTDVMFSLADNTRTFFHSRGANAVFDVADIDFSKMNARFFHIGYALLLDRFDAPDAQYGTMMARALHMAQQHGLKTSMDVVSESGDRFARVVAPSLKYCDYLIINEVEASMICGLPVRKDGALSEALLKQVCQALIDKGVGEWAVIHAPEASCAMDANGGGFTFEPSLNLPPGYIKGTVGAGDAFCAGMLYAFYQGYDIKTALKIGAGAAACCLSSLNAVDGMQSIEGIREVITRYQP